MDRPSRELYQSFARLNNTSPEIIEWLKQGYEDQKETNIFLQGEEGIRGQGKAEVLKEIIDHINDFEEALKKRDYGDTHERPHTRII